MNFSWTWIILALVGVWCVGWWGCTFYMFFFGPGSDDKTQDRKDRLMGSFFISALLWPALLPSSRRFMSFQKDLETGKRPKWLVYADGEQGSGEWTLADGTQFWASPVRGSSTEPTLIQAGFEGAVVTDCVECRVQLIAPDTGEPTEWKTMRLKKPVRDPEDEDDEEDDEPFYETSLKLSRGKYRVDLRVQLRAREAEELGSVIVIVSDSEDYNL
ncbi:MAG TPA: hypothetical protein VJW76_13525 [Verrucomicrobiae bacterium]|nr:hypothetical protein [Verrucomicrobiae bacterium]